MTAPVLQLPPHNRMTPQECLQHCALDHADWQEVIVIGTDAEGELKIRSSGMSRKDALWLLEWALPHIMGQAE